jgi:HSP20 family protein
MTTFLDKLKKGMDSAEPFNQQEDLKNDIENNAENNPEDEKLKTVKEENLTEKTTINFTSASVPNSKTVKQKKAKTQRTSSASSKTKSMNQSVKQKLEEKMKPIQKIKIEKIETVKNEGTRQEKKWFEAEGELTVDVYQTDKEIVIQSAIAGVETENIDVFIENDLVSIKGNRVKPCDDEEKSYFYEECYWGPFSREIILPAEVDPSRINATMKQGILTIKIPKIERERKRKVNIVE